MRRCPVCGASPHDVEGRWLCGRVETQQDDGVGHIVVTVRRRCVSSVEATLRALDRLGIEARKHVTHARPPPRMLVVHPAPLRNQRGRFQASISPPAISPGAAPMYVMSKKR